MEIWVYLSFFFWYRRISKWLLHISTGSCELQRICYKTNHGAGRTKQIGMLIVLIHSKTIERVSNGQGETLRDSETSHTFASPRRFPPISFVFKIQDSEMAFCEKSRLWDPRNLTEILRDLTFCGDHSTPLKEPLEDIRSIPEMVMSFPLSVDIP